MPIKQSILLSISAQKHLLNCDFFSLEFLIKYFW